jgi:response regulator RpfG family c-di-GMP phosphodiesterase
MNKFKIVMVDDNWEICELFKTIIQNLEMFEVISFDKGYRFLEYIEENKYDIAIVDIDLPDISGYEIIKNIRNEQENYAPIIVISAFEDFAHKIKALELGADDYIVKPVNIFEVVIKMNNLLKRQSYLSELNKRESIIQEKAEIIKILKSFFNEKVYQPAIKLKKHFDTELSKGKSSFSPDKIFDTYKKLSDDFDFLIKNFEKLSNEIEKRIEKIEEKKAEFLPEKEIEKKFKTKF